MADLRSPWIRAERFVGPGGPDVPPGLRLVVAASVCLVLYSYLAALWADRHGPSPRAVMLVRAWLNKPAGIGEDFGVLGLAMLLMVAGYLLAQAGIGTITALLARPVLLVMPAVLVCVTASALVLDAGGEPLTDPADTSATPGGWLAGVLLIDRILGQPALLPLAWPVTVAAMFFVLLLASLGMLPRRPMLAVAGQVVEAGAIVVLGAQVSGGPLRELGLLAGFVPMAILGELIWLVRAGRIAAWPAGGLGVGAGAVMVTTHLLYAEWDAWWYPVTGLYALLIVLVALPSGAVLGRTLVVRWLASRAIWLVLTCGVIGYGLLGALEDRMPVRLALVLAILATGVAVEAGYRWVQVPLGRLADRLEAGGMR